MPSLPHSTVLGQRHRTVALVCVGVASGMLALAYAAVPLYRMFCQVTGFGGTTQRASAPPAPGQVAGRTIQIRFDANVAPGLPWRFEPVARTMDVRIGETALAIYRATNTSERATFGTASYNVVPDQTGIYFNKLACFCFTEQRLEPGQSVDMPVQFFVDPAIDTDAVAARVPQITLSYTFYPVAAAKKGVAETAPAGKPPG